MNPHVTERLVRTAQQHALPYQLAAIGRATPNDANVLQISRQGVATGLVSLPNRYMHSAVETVSLDDLDAAADLLAAFIGGLKRRRGLHAVIAGRRTERISQVCQFGNRRCVQRRPAEILPLRYVSLCVVKG